MKSEKIATSSGLHQTLKSTLIATSKGRAPGLTATVFSTPSFAGTLEEAINIGVKNLYVEGDSLLVIKQMKGLYKVKAENLYKLYENAKKLEKQFTTVSYNHVYRDKNKRADELSNMALRS